MVFRAGKSSGRFARHSAVNDIIKVPWRPPAFHLFLSLQECFALTARELMDVPYPLEEWSSLCWDLCPADDAATQYDR